MDKHFTKRFNTPCAPSWTTEWRDTVNEYEERLGHPICGARTPDGTPCTLPPNHTNGRCRFHGGFSATGAQPGNRNAILHGLYARGLQRCGAHCPQWNHCPCAGEDVEQLSTRNRPQCPYETTQYQMALTDLKIRRNTLPEEDELDNHTTYQAALLHVMVLRAATALTLSGLTDSSTVKSGEYTMENKKTAAALTAFLRLSAEYRRYLATFESATHMTLSFNDKFDDTCRRQHDTELTPEAQEQLNTTPVPGKEYAEFYTTKAAECLRKAKIDEEESRRPTEDDEEEEDAEEERECDRKRCQKERQTATAWYQKAFILYPPLAEILKNNPNHDPALFPKIPDPTEGTENSD